MTTANSFVDCSSNNGIPNVAAYKASGHRTLCRKVSEGAGYHWVEGDAVADLCHKAGLTVGSYHWLRPDSSATAQAAFFVAKVKPHLKPGDWLMTDFERTEDAGDPGDTARAGQLATFNAYVRTHLPTYPLYVYTGNWYLAGKPHCQAECRRWPVVMSDYASSVLPNPYGLRYVAWQHTDRANVAGFKSPVDYNRWLTPPPAPVKPAEPNWSDDMPLIVRVSKTDAARLKVRWPGIFLLHGALTHIATSADYAAYKKAGVPEVTDISIAEYHNLGGR